MAKADAPQIADRIMTREWQLDLSEAGKAKSPKLRPANRRRQRIVSFLGRDDETEKFSIRQTIPHPGHDTFCPPSQAQYGAVLDFFQECCEVRSQANIMLSARDFAEGIARSFPFTAPRGRLIWISTTAFILSDRKLRSLVRTWNISHRGHSAVLARGAYLACYKEAKTVDCHRELTREGAIFPLRSDPC